MAKDWLDKVHNKQKSLQIAYKSTDDLVNVLDVYNSATAALVEIGEMLQCDTRWKEFVTGSKKKPVVCPEQFKEEWADTFIYMLNVLIYAGISVNDIKTVVENKQNKNYKRFGYV
jgi:NTP pyrophosphatase (non-canonical NTP hydrolase)